MWEKSLSGIKLSWLHLLTLHCKSLRKTSHLLCQEPSGCFRAFHSKSKELLCDNYDSEVQVKVCHNPVLFLKVFDTYTLMWVKPWEIRWCSRSRNSYCIYKQNVTFFKEFFFLTTTYVMNELKVCRRNSVFICVMINPSIQAYIVLPYIYRRTFEKNR